MSPLLVYQPCPFSLLPLSEDANRVLRTSQVSFRLKCSKAENPESSDPLRRSANYQKNIWSLQQFQTSISSHKEKWYAERVRKLKEIVRDMLMDAKMGTSAKLELIDNIQKLGVAYHFDKEIKETLGLQFILKDTRVLPNLYSASLYFRLLRQHRCKVSPDVLKSFTLNSCEDVKGILSLYEASHLCVEGEDMLHDESKDSAAQLRKHLDEHIDQNLAKEVARSLEVPLHRRNQRLEARHCIDLYQREEKLNPTLVEFAMLDFNMLQIRYQEELENLARWWKHLGLSNELSFARDRLVECFVASIGGADNPQYQRCREWTTKVDCLVVTIDDIYDTYGSLDELVLFTTAIEGWDLKAMDDLPDYMRICFFALFNTTNDIAYMIFKDQGIDISWHLKQVWADFCNAMLAEAKWSEIGYTPTLMEYLENAWVSSSATVGLVMAFYATQKPLTDSALASLHKKPDLIYYSSMILRLCNDLATSSAEQARGHVPSAIQCYMQETNTSEQDARERIKGLISEMWMKLNTSMYNSAFEDSFINIVVNIARTAHIIHQYGDGISTQDNDAKKRISELLFEPISISHEDFSLDFTP